MNELARVLSTSYQMAVCAKLRDFRSLIFYLMVMAIRANLTYLISYDNWQGFRPNANGCLCQDFAYECLRKVKRFSVLLLKLIARVRTFDGPMAADAKQCMNVQNG